MVLRTPGFHQPLLNLSGKNTLCTKSTNHQILMKSMGTSIKSIETHW